MQAQSHGILSRSSSTTLSVAGRPAYVPEESVDDLAITQRLLDGPNHLGKHILVHEVPFSLDGSVAQDDSSDSHRTAPFEGRNRRGFGTSNTWTSSSGEMLSEQDEIDDRMTFVQEYNRLAKKVQIIYLHWEKYANCKLLAWRTKYGCGRLPNSVLHTSPREIDGTDHRAGCIGSLWQNRELVFAQNTPKNIV